MKTNEQEFKDYLERCKNPETEVIDSNIAEHGIGKGFHTMKEICAYVSTLPEFTPTEKDIYKVEEFTL